MFSNICFLSLFVFTIHFFHLLLVSLFLKIVQPTFNIILVSFFYSNTVFYSKTSLLTLKDSTQGASSDGWVSVFQDRDPRFESPGPPTQGIFLTSYLVSIVSRVLWHPGISRDARKLTRTPSLSKNKKKNIKRFLHSNPFCII